jgi:hypothetical protein
MKPEGPAKHFIVAFLLAMVGYVFFYQTIEYRRIRKGPWQVTFTHSTAGAPAIVITQPKLAITNVQIVFPGGTSSVTNTSGALAVDRARPEPPATTLQFAQPQPVPYDVPFGKCVFMDTTFLPGTVTFQLFGHEIELLPRVLVIDRREHRWQSDSVIVLSRLRPAPPARRP